MKAAATFNKDLAERPAKAGARKADTAEREEVFSRLRYQTSWLRRAGRAALRTSKSRAEFDRVSGEAPKSAATAPKVPKPAPAES